MNFGLSLLSMVINHLILNGFITNFAVSQRPVIIAPRLFYSNKGEAYGTAKERKDRSGVAA
jgi:hypothetical protein